MIKISKNCPGRFAANCPRFLPSHSVQFYTHLFKYLENLTPMLSKAIFARKKSVKIYLLFPLIIAGFEESFMQRAVGRNYRLKPSNRPFSYSEKECGSNGISLHFVGFSNVHNCNQSSNTIQLSLVYKSIASSTPFYRLLKGLFPNTIEHIVYEKTYFNSTLLIFRENCSLRHSIFLLQDYGKVWDHVLL